MAMTKYLAISLLALLYIQINNNKALAANAFPFGVPGCYYYVEKKLVPFPVGCPCNSPGAHLQCNEAHSCRGIGLPIPPKCPAISMRNFSTRPSLR
jgi:hypothetical protein